jgi:hypothetical protein
MSCPLKSMFSEVLHHHSATLISLARPPNIFLGLGLLSPNSTFLVM